MRYHATLSQIHIFDNRFRIIGHSFKHWKNGPLNFSIEAKGKQQNWWYIKVLWVNRNFCIWCKYNVAFLFSFVIQANISFFVAANLYTAKSTFSK